MKKLVLMFTVLTASVTASACTVQTTKVTAPDGEPALAMRCRTMANCYKAAGEQCSKGYNVIQQNTADIRGRGAMLFRCKE